MQIISEACESILKIMERFRKNTPYSRMMTYCVEEPTEEGMLLFHLLTREMVLLTEEEWENRYENEYLQNHWFVVPEDCKDKEYADLVRWVLKNKQKKKLLKMKCMN